MAGNEGCNVEFCLCVEAPMSLRHLLSQNPICTDQFAIVKKGCVLVWLSSATNHDEMIADRVETIAIHAKMSHFAHWRGTEFLVEHAIAQPLAGRDLVTSCCLPQQQLALFRANVPSSWQRLSLLSACLPQTTRE